MRVVNRLKSRHTEFHQTGLLELDECLEKFEIGIYSGARMNSMRMNLEKIFDKPSAKVLILR